jgi:hypothetical protein
MFGEPPPVYAAPPVMIAALVESLPIPPVEMAAPRDDGAFQDAGPVSRPGTGSTPSSWMRLST